MLTTSEPTSNCCKNTDKEIWRQTHEDYYSPSIHVTEQGTIGIKCGGHVIVATVQDWHNWGKEALLDAVDHAVPAEPPKPTGEQLKGSCTVESSTCPTPQPALMICNHAGECKREEYCERKKPHEKLPACGFTISYHPEGCPFPLAVCVPLVEPVVHTDCCGCDSWGEKCRTCFPRYGEDNIRRNYTPKEPEPAAKLNHHNFSSRPCSTCGWMKDGFCGCTIECHGDQWKAREPKAEPGLIDCKIVGGKGNELWIVDMPWGNSIALYKAVGRKDFDHIETKNGLDFEVLGAFNPNDPPAKCWFRK